MEINLPYNFDVDTRPFQAEIWDDPRMNKLLIIPRRHGKTSLAVNWLICEAIQNSGKVYWYVCPTQKMAKEIVWKAPDMLSLYLPPQVVKSRNEVELCIYLKNGAQIHFKGADNPDSLRGTNPLGVILDEYEQIKPEVYDEVLMPILKANGGWVWLMGTPKGKNDFYKKKIALEKRSDWQIVHLRASEAKILSEAILKEAKEAMSEAAFRQEFETEFLEGAGSVFRRILENISSTIEEPVSGHDYVIGVDLAKHVDFTVLKVFDTSTWKEVYTDRFNQIDWNLQKARIEALSRRYNNAMIRVDSTGVGDPITEDLNMLGLMVEPYSFTNNSKAQLIQNLSMLLESDQIKILPDSITVAELESYAYEITPSGKVTYSAPAGHHDDCVTALALAVWKLPPRVLRIDHSDISYLDRPTGLRYEGAEPIYD